MIHSGLEGFIPDRNGVVPEWNESFRSGKTYTAEWVSSTWPVSVHQGQLSLASRTKFKTFHNPENCSNMDKDLIDIISKEFSFFSQEELEQAVEQAREEIQADLGK